MPTWVKLEGYEGDKISEMVTITSKEDQPLKITDITCDIKDKIKYKLKTEKKGKEYVLKIKNRPTEEGSFRGKIELKTNSKKKSLIVLSIYGRLKKEVIIKPKSISFGTINTTKDNFDAEILKKTVVLKDIRGNGLTVKKIKSSSKWILTETKTQRGGKQYAIVITLDRDKLPKGHFEEKIKIRTNYKRKSLVVDLKGEVI